MEDGHREPQEMLGTCISCNLRTADGVAPSRLSQEPDSCRVISLTRVQTELGNQRGGLMVNPGPWILGVRMREGRGYGGACSEEMDRTLVKVLERLGDAEVRDLGTSKA